MAGPRLPIFVLVAVVAAPGWLAAATRAIAASPSGERFVFSSNRDVSEYDIYSAAVDGTDVRRLTNNATADSMPSSSPDGSKIAFASAADGTFEVTVMDADGSNSQALTSGTTNSYSPSWSPSGAAIAFSRDVIVDNNLQSSEIWTMTSAGANQSRLTQGHLDGQARWSPDGTRIAFVRDGLLWIMLANGSNAHVLVTSVGTGHGAPSWSPDSQQIAWGGADATTAINVWIVKADGTNLHKLTGVNGNLPIGGRDPAWSPDGRRIVLMTGAIATIRPDGSCPMVIAPSLRTGSSEAAYDHDVDWARAANGPLGITLASDCVNVAQGQSTSFTVNVVRNGLADPVTLSASGLPPGASATFSPNPATGNSSVVTIKTSNCGTYTPDSLMPDRLAITATAGGLTRLAVVTLLVGDGPPIMTPPAHALRSGTTLGSTTVSVKTSWNACDGPTGNLGMQEFNLGRQVNGGTWPNVTLNGVPTSINQTLTIGTDYRYRARATDYGGKTSAWAYGPTFDARVTQQTSTSVKWSGTWTTGSSSSYSGGSTRYAKTAGASASFTFTGLSIAWVGGVGPTRGSAQVYIDGVLKATISTYASAVANKRLLYATSWPTSGTHTIKIVVLGTSGHPWVHVDAFVRLYKI